MTKWISLAIFFMVLACAHASSFDRLELSFGESDPYGLVLKGPQLNGSNYRRQLQPGSLAAFPIPNFGAIAQGTHRFCESDSTACDGLADFLIV